MRYCKQVVRHARCLVCAEPSKELQAEVRRYIEFFDNAASVPANGGINLFAFHVDVPADYRVINYVDVKHDHGLFDYKILASHLVWSTSLFNPGTGMIFVTDAKWDIPVNHKDLVIVRLPLETSAPMFERVKAMTAYVNSKSFSRNTLFLDTDAFPNREISSVFSAEFNVGVTYRTVPGFMPINEGVIFCSVIDREAAKRFFWAYLATYERLIADPAIKKYYGDIKRWRGGQLALSALASPAQSTAEVNFLDVEGVRVRLFPCDEYNYAVTKPIPRGGRTLNQKYVLHLKGDGKKFIDSLVNYQQHHAHRLPLLHDIAKGF